MGDTNLDALVLSGALDVEAITDDVLSVPNVASGGVLAAHVTDAMTHTIRIQSADGTNYYIMCTTTVTNRTGGG